MGNPNIILILILFASYIIGSFPTSIIMGRVTQGKRWRHKRISGVGLETGIGCGCI